jgi:anti-sigma factor RsiW
MKRRHLGNRLSALIDGELTDAGRERVLAHLARCAGCRQEAASLRLLKRRMYALGDAAADDELTWRLLALAPDRGWGARGRRARARWPMRPRRRWARSLVAAGVAVAGLSLSSAAFVAGGDRPPSGPRVVPAVDVFMVQHAITTGQVPVWPSGVPSAAASSGVP